MLKFANVTKTYFSVKKDVIEAVKNVSFSLRQGEFVSLVGKSGAGKTTLIKLLIGEENPTAGSIYFKDIDLNKLSPWDLQKIRRKIGVVYQNYKLLSEKTVAENLSYIMQVIGAAEQSICRDVPQVLEMVGLYERACNFPKELSGGEQQRLAIARALIHRPDLVVADEPTGNLDLYNTYEIINLLEQVNNRGTTVILATHDKEIINKLKKRVITLDNGEIIADDEEGSFIL